MEGRSPGADGTASARQKPDRVTSVDQTPPARPSAVSDGTSFADGVFAPNASTERERDQCDGIGKPKKTTTSSSASTSSGSTFEERLHSKLSQSAETGKPTKTSTASTSSGSTFEERLHNKLSSSASLRRQASQRNYQLYQLLRVVHSRNACTVNSTSLPMPPSQLSRFRTMSATHQGHIRLSLTGR